MMLVLENTQPIIAADARVVGAAVKILVAGGTTLDADDIERASGVTSWVWGNYGIAILSMVALLEVKRTDLVAGNG